MKKLMGNVAVKIAAVFFSFVFALSSFLCVVAAIAAVESDMYVKSKDEIKSSILESKLSQYCGNVVEIYEFHEEIEDFCDYIINRKNCNIDKETQCINNLNPC